MKIIEDKISLSELQKMAKQKFGNLVKAVVDIQREIMVVDGDLHSDEESWLLENGSKQENLWGINLYPFSQHKDLIEFDSLINLRPSQGNLSRGVDNPIVRQKIIKIIKKLIKK